MREFYCFAIFVLRLTMTKTTIYLVVIRQLLYLRSMRGPRETTDRKDLVTPFPIGLWGPLVLDKRVKF